VAREVIAPDCEDVALGTDVGAKISQNGTRRGAIRHVDDKTAVHKGGELDRVYRLEEELDVKFVRLEFGSHHEPTVGGHVAPNPETAMRKGEGEPKLAGVPIVAHLESPPRQHPGGKRRRTRPSGLSLLLQPVLQQPHTHTRPHRSVANRTALIMTGMVLIRKWS
jgi:hypothetical protein